MPNPKQQEEMNKRFDEQFKYVFAEKDPDYGAENKANKINIKAFLQSEISRALDNQMKEVIECLPGTVVLDQSFYENQDSKEFIEWAAYCKYKEDLLTNLKSRGLI